MLELSPTFLDSFAYYQQLAGRDEAESKRLELLNRLRGIKSEPNEAQLKGLAFEMQVLQCTRGILANGEHVTKCALDIASQITAIGNELYQVPVSLKVDNILLMGYVDFLTPYKIIDIKTTKKYQIGKYRNNMQHKIYTEALAPFGYKRFEYFVTDFYEVYFEEYIRGEEGYMGEITSAVRTFISYCQYDTEMMKALIDHKCYRGEDTDIDD